MRNNIDFKDFRVDPTVSYGDAHKELKQVHDKINKLNKGKRVFKNSRFELSKKIESEVRNNNHSIFLNARNHKSLSDVFRKAVYNIENHNYSTDGYYWIVHSTTLRDIEKFYKNFNRLSNNGDLLLDEIEFMGVPFLQGKEIPVGWIVLADREFLIQRPIKSHPMSVIQNASDGYPETINMDVGGEMELRVIRT